MINQFVLNAVIAGSVYSLVGIGFALIFDQAKFFHFSHAAVFTVAPYAVVFSAHVCGLALPFALLIGVAVATFIGLGIELFLYRPLRDREASSTILLLTSLGVYVVIENTISAFFGDQTKSILIGEVLAVINLFGGRITEVQIATVITSILGGGCLLIILHVTRLGRAMRAISSDSELARVCGVDENRVLCVTFIIASILAGIAGILVALDVAMIPTMGMPILMMAIVAAFVGGISSIPGVMLGGLFLGFAQQFGTLVIKTEWQDAIAFVILLIFLFSRPSGLIGKRIKKTTV